MPGRRFPTLPHTVPDITAVPLKATTTSCPICGRPLERPGIASTDPDVAPWLCNFCRQGFWNAELCPAARRAFRSASRDFGFTASWLREAVRTERGQ